MSKINNGGPAFPVAANEYGGHGTAFGMSMRDYFAAKAMQGLLASEASGSYEVFAEAAYLVADEMLRARGAA